MSEVHKALKMIQLSGISLDKEVAPTWNKSLFPNQGGTSSAMEQLELSKCQGDVQTVKGDGETEKGKCCSFPLPNTCSLGLVNGADLQSLPNLWMCLHPLSWVPEEGVGVLYGILPTFRKVGEVKLVVDPHRIDDECSRVTHKREDLLLPKILL